MTIRGGAPGGRAPAGAGDDLADLLSRVAARDAAAFAALYKQTSAKLYGVVARILTTRRRRRRRASGGLCAHLGKGRRIRSRSRARRSPGWRPSPAIARSTRCGACARFRSRISRRASNPQRRRSTRSPRGNGPRGSRRWSTVFKALDEEKRAVVLLAYYRGLSREALAKRFGRPVPTIKTWLHRSLAQLRDCLAS